MCATKDFTTVMSYDDNGGIKDILVVIRIF